MTPKEKAIQLINRFTFASIYFTDSQMVRLNAKECALIAVDNTIEALQEYDNDIEGHLQKVCPDFYSCQLQNMDWDIRYWHQVKTEIENL